MRDLVFMMLLAALSLAAVAEAQPTDTRLAAYESLRLPAEATRVTFQKQPAAVGDRIQQQVSVSFSMDSTTRRGGEVIDSSSNTIARQQQRTVQVEEVAEGRTVAARVHFGQCSRTVDGERGEAPIAGHAYTCRRLADDRLDVLRSDGSLVSPDEFALVSDSMASLGRPNPLADFLAGHTIAVGHTIEVPQSVGDALLASDGTLGKVDKFTLELQQFDAANRVATFAVSIETRGAQTTQMRLIVTGTLEVEGNTCRTRRLDFAGPMCMATTVGSYSAAEVTLVRGKLHMQMTADYAKQ